MKKRTDRNKKHVVRTKKCDVRNKKYPAGTKKRIVRTKKWIVRMKKRTDRNKKVLYDFVWVTHNMFRTILTCKYKNKTTYKPLLSIGFVTNEGGAFCSNSYIFNEFAKAEKKMEYGET